jgi:hypothetical protein
MAKKKLPNVSSLAPRKRRVSQNRPVIINRYIDLDPENSGSSGSSLDNESFEKFNSFGIQSDLTLTSSDFSNSNNTFGVSADTDSSSITITLPSGLDDDSELTVQNLSGTNSLFVVPASGETISSDPTGIDIDREGGVIIKKSGLNWVLVSKYISNSQM